MLEISSSYKRQEREATIRHLELVSSNIARSGSELTVCLQRFRKVPFSSGHTYTRKQRVQKVLQWRAFSKSSVFIDRFHRIRVH